MQTEREKLLKELHDIGQRGRPPSNNCTSYVIASSEYDWHRAQEIAKKLRGPAEDNHHE